MLAVDLPPAAERTDVDSIERLARRRTGRLLVAAAVVVVVAGTVSAVTLGLRGAGGTPDPTAATVVPGTCAPPQDLTAPGFGSVYVRGADPTGRYLFGGGVSNRDGEPRMLLWRDGVATGVEIPEDTHAAAVNSAGVVVGGLLTYPPDRSSAWVYRDGQVRTLAPPDGYNHAFVTAINARGDMAGVAARNSNSWTAVLWPADTPDKPVALDAPSNAIATGIADDGTVVGTLFERGDGLMGVNTGTAYAWAPGGRGRDLDTPAGWAGAKAERVLGDWIYGYAHQGVNAAWTKGSSRTGLPEAPVRWRIDGTAAELAAPDGSTYAGTSASGWWMEDPSGPLALTVDGRSLRLDLREAATGRPTFFLHAFWVGDGRGGELVVYGSVEVTPDKARAVRWVCQLPPR